MIVTSKNDITTNISQAREFQASTDSSRLFAMLSNYLYSNPRKAVLNEIAANAKDSHQQNGNVDRPITIISPTKLDPHLRIRDYGTGLSEDDVYRLLTTYGESGSHKRSSNEYEGAWGIGSKSVAAVASTWKYKSWFGGQCKEYLVFINEKSIPSLTKICENGCDISETGFEVSIPIKSDDFSSWTNLFSEVFKHYPVRPEFKNSVPTFDSVQIIFEHESFNIYSAGVCGYYDNTKFIVSGRGYPGDISKVYSRLTISNVYSRLTVAEINFANSGKVLFKFKTGELEVSLNREELQYTEYTLQCIAATIKKAYAAFLDHCESIVCVAKTSLEYRSLLQGLLCKFSFNTSSHAHVIDNILKDNVWNIGRNDLQHYNLEIGDEIVNVYNGKNIRRLTSGSSCWKTCSFMLRQKTVQIKTSIINDNFKIIVNDVNTYGSRIRGIETNNDNIILIVPSTLAIPPELSGYVFKASAFPIVKKTRVASNVSPAPNKDFVLWAYDSYYNNLHKMRSVPTDFTNFAYFNFDTAKKYNGNHRVTNEEISALDEFGIKAVGIKKKGNVPVGLKTVKEALTEKFAAVDMAEVEISYAFKNVNIHKHGIDTMSTVAAKMIGNPLCVKYKNIITKYLTVKNKYTVFDMEFRKYEALNKALGNRHDLSKVTTLDDVLKEWFDMYPLLRYSCSYSCMSATDVVDYVSLVNSSKGIE